MKENSDKFNKLLEQILTIRSDLTRERILQLIEEKKKKVGAGYLTDLGALYLVINDLGIKLEEYMRPSEIKSERHGVNISSFLLSHKKYQNRTVFFLIDTEPMRGVYWGQEDLFRDIRGVVRVNLKNVSIRKSKRGTLEVHANDRSQLLVTDERYDLRDFVNRFPDLKKHFIIGIVEGPFRTISYKRKDGTEGHGIGFFVRGQKRVRVVLWDYEGADRIKEGLTLVAGPAVFKSSAFGDEAALLNPFNMELYPSIMSIYRAQQGAMLLDEFGHVHPAKVPQECIESKSIVVIEAKYEFPTFNVIKCTSYEGATSYKPVLDKIASAEKGYVSMDFIMLSEVSMKTPNRYEAIIGDDTGEGVLIIPSELIQSAKKLSVGEKVRALGLLALGEQKFMMNEYTVFLNPETFEQIT